MWADAICPSLKLSSFRSGAPATALFFFDRVLKVGIISSLLALSPSLSFGRELVASGHGLVEPISVLIDWESNQYVLVSASQYYADYSLTLREYGNDTVIREVNAPVDKGLDELMLINRDDCQVCEVTLSASAPVDSQSNFEVWISYPKEHYKSPAVLVEAVGFFENYTRAMSLMSEAGGLEPKTGKKELKEAVVILERAINSLHSSSLEQYRLIAMMTLAQIYDHIGEDYKFKSSIETLLSATEGKNSSIRAYALYDLAPAEPDIVRQLKLYDQATQIAAAANDTRLMAKILNRKAIGLVNSARYGEAISLLSEALSINREAKRVRPLIKNLSNLSWASTKANLLPEAIKYATEHKIISERYREETEALWSMYRFGMAYGKLGERYAADRFLDKALDRQSSQNVQERSSSATLRGYILKEQAIRLMEHEDFDLALTKAEEMRQVFSNLGYASRASDADSLIGQIAFSSGDYELARYKFDASIEFDVRNSRSRSLGVSYLNTAELEHQQGDFFAASRQVNKALKILQTNEDRESLSKSLSFSLEVLRSLGGAQQAKEISSSSRKLLVDNLEAKGLSEYWYRNALVELDLGAHAAAIESLRSAREVLEKELPKVKREDLRRRYLGLQKNLFDKSIDTLMQPEINDVKSALALVESFKARTLEERLYQDVSLARISESQELERNGIHAKLLGNAMRYFKNKEGSLESVLQSSKRLSNSLASLEQEVLDNRSEKLAHGVPTEIDSVLARKKPTNMDLGSVALERGGFVAVYFTGENNSWLWLINEGQIEGHMLPAKAVIDNLTEQLVSTFSIPPSQRTKSVKAKQDQLIYRLSEKVLGPLMPKLQEGKVSDLLIVPDGSLFSVPFSALIAGKGGNSLVSSTNLSFAPSLHSRNLLKQRSYLVAPHEPEVLVFANAGYSESPEASFGVIPFSEVEADSILNIMGSRAIVYKGEDANKQQLNKSLENDYEVIHFATHGLLSNEISNLSGLSFPTEDGETSLWMIPEILNSRVRAELVFLSACETAIGRPIPGEGLIGLSRAFLEAGAKNVIGTLWNVQDKVTAELVKHFYFAYSKLHYPHIKALRYAQTKISSDQDNDWSDPYYWAGFQLMGDGR